MEFNILIKMIIKKEENTQENLKMVIEKEKAYFIGMMVINMKVIGKMVNLKEKEYITLMMAVNMKVIGKMV